MTAPSDVQAEQRRVVLTSHPLQRVGAFALAHLAGARLPDEISSEGFDHAVERMTEDAVSAGLKASTKDSGAFWLKASGSFFPNSKMNHPTRTKKPPAQITAEVRAWRRMPDAESWPEASCALCGRRACGFYGKVDVMLGASVSYRNTTPRGHEGLALCFACLCCFYALPYGSVLTGGPSIAVHSWDDAFLVRTTRSQARRTSLRLAVDPVPLGPSGQELVALQALRQYDRPLRAGIELMVFNNNNQDQSLRRHPLDEPLAEWLRTTMTNATLWRGFVALLRAHRTKDRSGSRRLAWNAVHAPSAILSTSVSYLRARSGRAAPLSETSAALIPLCFSYVIKVMGLKQADVAEVRSLAGKIATVIARTPEQGPLSTFRARHRRTADLRAWFRTRSMEWTLGRYADPSNGGAPPTEPFVTTRQWRLLFDPAEEEAWAYRELLLIAVLEGLHDLGWRPAPGETAVEDDPDAESPEIDEELLHDRGNEEGDQ